jgi:subtilisin family serine protease
LNSVSISSEQDVKDLKIIDGIAMQASENQINKIAGMNFVKKVELDQKVNILLSDSVPLMNASRVWRQLINNTNATGVNVTIAIIDTGVDYTHPDLGGCLGAGCKVVGGYDFINNDADPMDDHGHGTHVAATAASNGSLLGVAPGAKIYAYKVLNSGGSGSFSQVVSGIDRATDPNNDGDFSDHVDIISMSLGGSGNEDSSASIASDRAVSRGVVVVVAAGNSGTATNAIGTPGSSRRAITIAASDKSDQIAYFSSRGPTPKNNLKPDVSAPGVNICAAEWDSAWSTRRCIDNRHVSISGTSMATPHVAGLAALVKQLNPTWQPEIIKSAIISTTKERMKMITRIK